MTGIWSPGASWRGTYLRFFHRIYRAAQRGNRQLVRKLQGLLTRSWSAKMMVVRQVTQQNQGKKTAGVDGVVALKPSERQPLVRQLKVNDGKKVKPTRRVWIPKPGRDEKRPLGIPTIYDRALQGLVKIALEPEWEAMFEANSYGFRPGRGCHDAIGSIFDSINKKPKWVLDADIAKCFDKIDHRALLKKLNNSTPIRKKIREWLKAGVMDRHEYQPTYAGTPQGGIISPLLANIALHGMEMEVRGIVPNNIVKQQELGVVRYADDFVIMHKDREVIDAAKDVISKWLKGIGLELKPEKTRIAHTLEGGEPGFDFLGFNVRQYRVGKHRSGKTQKGYKTLIKPSAKSIKTHKEKLKTVVDNHKAAPQATLISKLNPIIRGWCNYHRTVVSKEIFGELDTYLWEITWKWARRRHPNKPEGWIARKYWKVEGSRQWNFMDNKGGKLLLHSETEIVRHVKVKGTVSPMDGNLVYWSKRLRKSPLVSPRVTKLMGKQKGKCGHCGMLFIDGDRWEIDHILPKSLGGKDRYDNLQLLHDYCHQQKTRTDDRIESRARKSRDRKIEEPDEVKVSRPVLKTSRTGDSLA